MALTKKPSRTRGRIATKSKSIHKSKATSALKRHRTRRKEEPNHRWLSFFWVVPTVFCIYALSLVVRAPSVHNPISVVSAHLLQQFEIAQTLSRPDRISFWSQALYQEPTLLSSLESVSIPRLQDSAPLFPHRYDCTTFVETVGALARSQTSAELVDQLVALRYENGSTDGPLTFETRNHFPEADWMPRNEQKGHLTDITKLVAKRGAFSYSLASKQINKLNWFNRHNLQTRGLASNPTTEVNLPYITLDEFERALPFLPQGAILNTVRESRTDKPVLITHQGFLVWKNDTAYFRHSSKSGQISETPIRDYIAASKLKPWKVLGFNIGAFL